MNYLKTISLVFLFPVLLQAQQTYKDYKIYRVLIAIDSKKDLTNGHERYKKGDIIDARPEHSYTEGLGKGEILNFISIRLQGFSRDILDSLTISGGDDLTIYQKRRFCIRLNDLKKQWPAFNGSQIHVLSDDREFLIKNGLFEAEGLIWDKKYMRFWR